MPERFAGRGVGFVTTLASGFRRVSRGLVVAAAAALALAGCREAEQGRAFLPEKGVYGGPSDQKLDPETLDRLRQRGMQQNFT